MERKCGLCTDTKPCHGMTCPDDWPMTEIAALKLQRDLAVRNAERVSFNYRKLEEAWHTLEAENAELKAQLASPMLRCHKAGHQGEIDALKAELKACEIALDGEIKAGDEARSENAKLREELEALKKPKAEAEIKEPQIPRRLTRGKYTFK